MPKCPSRQEVIAEPLLYRAATTPARTNPKPAPAKLLFRLSAPPVDCATVEEEEEEPVWLAALEDAVPVDDSLEEPEAVDSAAAEEVLDAESPEAEDVAEADESEEELPLAAAVELEPAAHVADWGKLLTP
jgi:hypothetical protein